MEETLAEPTVEAFCALAGVLSEAQATALLPMLPALRREAKDDLELEALLVEQRCADPETWSSCALRWALLGHVERALAALGRAYPAQRATEAPPDQAQVVVAALRGLWESRPESAVETAAPESSPAFVPDVLHLLRSEPDTSTRICLMSLLCERCPGSQVRSALEIESTASMTTQERIRDEAWGRASLHLSLPVRAGMWGRAFSVSRLAYALPFGWSSHGALEVAASLRDGEARDLVAWETRLEAR